MPRDQEQKIDVDWFKNQIKKKGLSQRKIAKELGINQSIISHIFTGRRKLGFDEAEKWAEILDVPFEELLDRIGFKLTARMARFIQEHDGEKKCPIYGTIDAEMNVEFEPNLGMAGSAPNPTGRDNVYALRFSTFKQGLYGSLIYFPLNHNTGVDPESVGRLSLVRVKGSEQQSIRIVSRGFDPGRYSLSLMDGQFVEQNVVLDLATPATWIKI